MIEGGRIRLRELRGSDALFLREMLLTAIFVPDGDPPPPESILDEPALRRYIDDFGARPGDLGLIAHDAGAPVGAAWVRLLTGGERGYGWVADDVPELSIAVRTSWRGEGLGTALLSEILRTAAAGGYDRVSLSVDLRSPARRLYERFGFADVGREGDSATMVASSSARPAVVPPRPG